MAGFTLKRTVSSTMDRVGTFYGQTSDDYREINAAQEIDTYFITGGIRAFGPVSAFQVRTAFNVPPLCANIHKQGRINYHFKFSGPSFNIDTACSSSLAAIQLACTSLQSGDCDTAIAGGLSVLTSPDLYAGLSRGQFLSKTGSCKTFDNAADGYCRGDSIGTVILKRLDDAIADRDNILGVILGAATNHSADAVSITHPHARTQERLYRKILAQAGIDPLDVDVAEMHGTGTQAGDSAEMESISNVFAPEFGGRSDDKPLYVGSVKANIGHGGAASGVTALIKSLLMFQKGTIPPHAGIKGLINQTFPDLDRRNIRIAKSKTPFKPRGSNKRRMIVNNFSAAGGNTALLLEDYLSPHQSAPDIRLSQPVVVSAKSTYSLARNIERLLAYLDDNPNTPLANLSYTTTARRLQHVLRVAASGTSLEQVSNVLRSTLSDLPVVAPPKLSKIAFAFTGQGSSYSNVGQDIYATSSYFRSRINHFDSLSQTHGFPSILPFLDKASYSSHDPSPLQEQLLHVCIQMALCCLWASWGIKPDIVVGHSLGEYAALYAASVLSSNDVLFLVGHRARLLEGCCIAGSHGMLAIRAQASSIQRLLSEAGWELEIACVNGPKDVVLSGLTNEIEIAHKELVSLGHKCKKIDVSYAFHSSQMDPILEAFRALSGGVGFQRARVPIVSPSLGYVIENADGVSLEYLANHTRNTVNFDPALRNAQQRGFIGESTGWIEIGPHPFCLGMVKAISKPSLAVASLRRDENAWKTLAESTKELYTHGVNLDWTEYHRDFSSCHQVLHLPLYAFEEKNYWLDYKQHRSLTKGEAEESIVKHAFQSFSTTTMQRIVSEEFDKNKAVVVFESDFSEASLHAAVVGHLVNNNGLCPSVCPV